MDCREINDSEQTIFSVIDGMNNQKPKKVGENVKSEYVITLIIKNLYMK